MNSKKKTLIISTIIILLLLLAVGVTYAFFSYESGTKSDIVTGQIYMNYEETSTISLTGVFPETKAQALARQDENGVFEFTITGRNTSKYPVYYEIDLLDGGVVTGKTETSTKILPEHVMIYLEKDGVPVIEGKKYADFNNRRIYVETVPANQTTNIEHKYTLRMWISDTITISDTDPNADYTTSEWNDSYASLKVRVVGDFEEKKVPIYLADKIEETLSLTDASEDIDGTRYVTGDTDTSNYVWYSGKLWRIVAINDDRSIKLVTQGNMTSVAWSTSSSNTDYSTSQIRSWLNNEFLPTINADLIVESNWDYTTYASVPTKKDTENAISISNKVGLLSVYDYMKTGGTDDSSTSKTFLNNGYIWWTISPQSDSSHVWYVSSYDGDHASNSGPTDSYGVRPSVNLKSDITLTDEGNGELETPYMLEGDTKVGQANELLSSRISGEYINFNNKKYRIVGTENGLTKITMADYLLNENTLSVSVKFGASEDESTFGTSYGIGKYLNDWYNATSENDSNGIYTGLYLSATAKAMIATPSDGVRWYAGPDGGTSYDYAKATQGTAIEAIIGLGRYGEMFSTQFGNGYRISTNTWLMTNYNGSNVWYVRGYSDAHANISLASSIGARPSMYLKSNVKIVSGSGMPDDPYEITQ